MLLQDRRKGSQATWEMHSSRVARPHLVVAADAFLASHSSLRLNLGPAPERRRHWAAWYRPRRGLSFARALLLTRSGHCYNCCAALHPGNHHFFTLITTMHPRGVHLVRRRRSQLFRARSIAAAAAQNFPCKFLQRIVLITTDAAAAPFAHARALCDLTFSFANNIHMQMDPPDVQCGLLPYISYSLSLLAPRSSSPQPSLSLFHNCAACLLLMIDILRLIFTLNSRKITLLLI